MNRELFEKVLEMPPNQRVVFAEMVLESIEHEDDKLRKEWLGEVRQRMKAVEEGRSKLLDFESNPPMHHPSIKNR